MGKTFINHEINVCCSSSAIICAKKSKLEIQNFEVHCGSHLIKLILHNSFNKVNPAQLICHELRYT